MKIKKKYKIAFIAPTYITFKAFMLNHIKELNKKYIIFIYCNDAHKLKNLVSRNTHLIDIEFKRNINILFDFRIFFVLLFFLFKHRPNLTISMTPKAGFIVSLASFISNIRYRLHWYTGQVWSNKNGLSKILFKFLDKIIFLFSSSVLVDSFSQQKFLIDSKIIKKDKSFVL